MGKFGTFFNKCKIYSKYLLTDRRTSSRGVYWGPRLDKRLEIDEGMQLSRLLQKRDRAEFVTGKLAQNDFFLQFIDKMDDFSQMLYY